MASGKLSETSQLSIEQGASLVMRTFTVNPECHSFCTINLHCASSGCGALATILHCMDSIGLNTSTLLRKVVESIHRSECSFCIEQNICQFHSYGMMKMFGKSCVSYDCYVFGPHAPLTSHFQINELVNTTGYLLLKFNLGARVDYSSGLYGANLPRAYKLF